MCGFAGVANRVHTAFKIDPALINNLSAVLAHRGPDGAGYWLSESHDVLMVHRRLSIVDLTQAGGQPMVSSDKKIVISFNGEIYNHQEIRKELKEFGHTFTSTSDTQVVLYAYKQWGINCIEKFDGMFAFSIFDKTTNELFLVRDRIGIKPLYFSTQGGVLSFASEIKALWHFPWMKKNINHSAVSHYLTYLTTPAPMTLYEGVYKLPAGFYAKLSATRALTFHEWYTPLTSLTFQERQLLDDEQQCIKKVRSLFYASVKKRMMADVPVGVFLSGGIDSSLNVAMMAQFTDKLNTFNVSFSDGPEQEERSWARTVAQKFGTKHHELILTEKEAFDCFEKMVYHQDEPLGDSVCVPLYYVAQVARQNGVPVVHTGEGADELFCGYDYYARTLRMQPYWSMTQKLMPNFAKKGLFHAASKWYPRHANRLDMLYSWSHNNALFYSGAQAFPQLAKTDLLAHVADEWRDGIVEQMYSGMHQGTDSYAMMDFHRKRLFKQDVHADIYKQMLYLELKLRLPELLLMRMDKMTMASSIEARVPFLDRELVEFALQIPVRFKYKQKTTKYILKKACEGLLPHDVIYRKKMGFAAPVTRWFRNGDYFKAYFNDLLASDTPMANCIDRKFVEKLNKDHQQGAHNYAYHLWAVQNLLALKL